MGSEDPQRPRNEALDIATRDGPCVDCDMDIKTEPPEDCGDWEHYAGWLKSERDKLVVLLQDFPGHSSERAWNNWMFGRDEALAPYGKGRVE